MDLPSPKDMTLPSTVGAWMAAKQRCPKCNALNDRNSSACASCGAPLVQVCAVCGTVRPWYVARCNRCESESQDSGEFSRLFQTTASSLIRDRYVVRETIHSSGISTVYRTVDAAHPTENYIVKAYSTVALFRARERRECLSAVESALRQWRSCDHPSLPKIIETFDSGERFFVVCQHIDGLGLDQIIEHPQMRVRPAIARNWGAMLCDLLAYLHEHTPSIHVPHLRPSHIAINSDGRPVLIGLGLSRFFTPGALPYGSARGYSAPELAETGPSTASDIFALGRLLYAILIDRNLERGMRKGLPLRQAVPGIGNDLIKAIASAAHRMPTRRYSSARSMAKALWPTPGPPEPLADWLQTVAAKVNQTQADGPSASTSNRTPVRATARAKNPMEAFGFQRDPRFSADDGVASQPIVAAETPTGAQSTPQMSLYPRSLNLGQIGAVASKRVALTLRNPGDVELSGRIVSQVPWLKAPSRLIRLPAGKVAKVLVTVRAENLSPGETNEPQALLVDTNAGRRWVGASATIPRGPNLAVEPAALDLGQFPQELAPTSHLTISNSGSERLIGRASATVDWLVLPNPDIACPAGQSVALKVTVLPGRMPSGPQSVADAILLDSDGGQARIAVQAQRLAAHLDLGARHMDLGVVSNVGVVERFLYLGNDGDGPLEGSIRSLVPWLQVFPSTIQCAPGDMAQLTIAADCSGLDDGVIEVPEAVRIHTNGGTCSLSLRLVVTAPDIRVEPQTVSFGSVLLGERSQVTVTVRNEGSAKAQIAVQSRLDWLSASSTSLTCAPEESVSLDLIADTSTFERGLALETVPALDLNWEGGSLQVSADLSVIKPSLEVSAESLDFGYVSPSEATQRQLTLTNDGTSSLSWQALSSAQWVEITPSNGQLAPGESVDLVLSAYVLALEAGVDRAESALILNSDAGRSKLPMRIALAEPLLATDTSSLDLGASQNWANVNGSFRVFNHGLGQLDGQVHSNRAWLAIERTSFRCPTGHSAEIGLTTDMTEFAQDESTDTARVSIESNGGSAEIDVTISVVLVPDVKTPAYLPLAPSGAGGWSARLVLKNQGLAPAHIQLETSDERLALSRALCDIKPGKSTKLQLEWRSRTKPTIDDDLAITMTCQDTERRIAVRLPDQVA